MKSPHTILTILFIFLSGCNTAPTALVNAPTGDELSFENTTVSLTFDDGDADNYDVRPILAENNLHATFYIVSGFTGTDGFMTADQLRGLYEDGNEIGGHTVSHVKLTEVRGADLRREVCQNRLDLMSLGFDVVSFAYPFGHYDEEAKQAVLNCGFNSSRVVTGGPDSVPPGDAYAVQAMPYIVTDTRVAKMKRYVTQVEDDGGGWVLFVFHHVCDKCDQYAIDLALFTEFARWLNEQQGNGLIVKTVGEVIGGEVKPGVQP
ncbi:MAG: polysaccharide deacetylase family protein [Chloroflexi bacterium]|nr:polysaccharide deacetylase family protein [Chloroflexota bacterium]